MSKVQSFLYTFMVICVVALVCFIYIVPVRSSTGIIDTTSGQCYLVSQKPTVKRYHLLLGQYHDYQLVRKHLIPTPSDICGQRAEFRLFL